MQTAQEWGLKWVEAYTITGVILVDDCGFSINFYHKTNACRVNAEK